MTKTFERASRVAWLWLVLLGLMVTAMAQATGGARTKKIVFLAGTKSHGPGAHEYEKGMRLLAHCLETASNLQGYRTEVHLYGWPENPHTLDDADSIVVFCDGSDHSEADHPLLTGDRLAILARQMRRGAGLAVLHYTVFVPTQRGGPEFLNWVGGYFDYQTGQTPNHWFSKIQVIDANPHIASPSLPLANGVASNFPLHDELYYNMRFRTSAPQITPVLTAAFPGEAEPQTIAWALKRTDGGRSFAFTGGHTHANWNDTNLRRLILNAIVWTAKGTVPAEGVRSTVQPDPIRALILTGYNHPAHDWRATTQALHEVLGHDDRFQITVCQNPERLASEDLSQYDLLIQNYCNYQTPTLSAISRTRLLDFVRRGGGLVLLHFANGAWRDWPDYCGRLSRRIWIDGKSNHDAYGPFHVHVTQPTNQLTRGIPDFDTVDELYCSQQGDLPVDPLLTARSRTTGADEPLAFTYTEGKGRIFQTLLGHDANAVRTPAHAELLRRAAAWVANREVLPLPVETQIVDRTPAGKFGHALDPRGAQFAAEGKMLYQEPPLTVECWAKLSGKSGFNILVANSAKESPKHWELYTIAGSGVFAAYLPGVTPTNVESGVDIVDGQWHYLAMTFLPGRLRLFVDGIQRADQTLGAPHLTPAIGPLWFGAYPPQNIGCDGLLDEVRISNIARDIAGVPDAPFTADENTIGLWHLDQIQNGQFADSSRTHNPLHEGNAAMASVAADSQERVPLPVVRTRDSVNWPIVGNDAGGMRYSQLTQINRNNVHNLKVAWVYHTGDAAAAGSTIECTPLVVDGVMYITTVKVKIVALNAATGKEIWEYDPHSGGVNRGVAYWSDGKPNGERRILSATGDGRLLSLDARTGHPDPNFGHGGTVDMRAGIERDISQMGYGSTAPPAIFENLAIVGYIVSEGMPGAPGDVRAFDVRTGKEVWRFHTVPRPGEFGNDTWENDGWKERTGVNAWDGYTVDTKHGIVFAGTGSASSDFYGADRLGANLFANCTLALDARTGKRLWHFQEVHHDLWDHDNPCPPLVVTVRHEGKKVEAVAQPTKTGFIFLFDRLTGKPLFDVHEVPAQPSDVPGERAWPTQPEPVKPPALAPKVFRDEDATDISPEAHAYVLEQLKKYRHGKAYIPPSVEGSIVSPGFHGGATWSGASFDPTTGWLYVNINNNQYIDRVVPNGRGGYDFTGYTYILDPKGYPAIKPPWGTLNAVDLNTGTIAWHVPLGEFAELKARGIPQTGTQTFGGTIATAGGLIFIGATMDEKFHAFDKTTGKLLWEVKLEAGGYATPSTYAVNGQQFVVIAAGGGGKLGTKSGDTFVAFALPHTP